jgi:hypothetical protein
MAQQTAYSKVGNNYYEIKYTSSISNIENLHIVSIINITKWVEICKSLGLLKKWN